MIYTMLIPAPEDGRFAKYAFENSLGKIMRLTTVAGTQHWARVTHVEVADDGRSAKISVDTDAVV